MTKESKDQDQEKPEIACNEPGDEGTKLAKKPVKGEDLADGKTVGGEKTPGDDEKTKESKEDFNYNAPSSDLPREVSHYDAVPVSVPAPRELSPGSLTREFASVGPAPTAPAPVPAPAPAPVSLPIVNQQPVPAAQRRHDPRGGADRAGRRAAPAGVRTMWASS